MKFWLETYGYDTLMIVFQQEINAESGYEPLAGKGSGLKMFDFLLQEDL